MTAFTKQEILDLDPCCPWCAWIAFYPNPTATGPQIESYIESLGQSTDLLYWLAGASVALATEMVTVVGINIDGQDGHGSTPLHYAVAHVQPTVITYLRGQGADKTIEDDDGISAEGLALLSGNDALIAAMEA